MDGLQTLSDAPTLLILDDEANVRSALQRLLRKEAYEIVLAATPSEAAAVMADKCPWVILADHLMPEMTGTEFLARARDRCPDSVRILLSGQIDQQAVEIALASGAVHQFVHKPWSDEDLRLSIREAFERLAAAAA